VTSVLSASPRGLYTTARSPSMIILSITLTIFHKARVSDTCHQSPPSSTNDSPSTGSTWQEPSCAISHRSARPLLTPCLWPIFISDIALAAERICMRPLSMDRIQMVFNLWPDIKEMRTERHTLRIYVSSNHLKIASHYRLPGQCVNGANTNVVQAR